jgi:hypothetical protein
MTTPPGSPHPSIDRPHLGVRGRAAVAAAMLPVLTALAAGPAAAQPPSPLGSDLFAFPGAFGAPSSAATAGLAFADRWLGDTPFDNPAVARRGAYAVTGALMRMSRQDLRVDNRNFDEQDLFIDFGGGYFAFPVSAATVSVYAVQPVLRREETAFTRGEIGGPEPPAVITSSSSARELRAGVGVAFGGAGLRLGAAAEWTRRSDEYETTEVSGSPDQGHRLLEMEGGGVGVAAGVRLGEDRPEAGAFTIGVSGRAVPELEIEGEQQFELLSGDSTRSFDATRESRVETGISASLRATEALRFVAGFGGHSGGDWDGLSGPGSTPVGSGKATVGALGLEFHDARDPWTLRIGYAIEREADAPEDEASALGLGFGWDFEGSTLDFGILHRTIERENLPNSYDDRLSITFRGRF